MGSLISGLFGGGSSPGQDAQMGALKASRDDIQRYRPEAMQARINALNNMTSSFQGANNALETLWGDPNAPKSTGAPPPQRMMGHDLPQEMPYQQGPMSPPPQSQQGGGFNPLDPLGIFGKR
jgi:hypothetical protein